MAKAKLGVSKSEMLQMREQGLSNRDIAKCLDIHIATVYNYISKQGGRIDNLAAFDEPKPKQVGTSKEEPKAVHKAVDKLMVLRESVMSADCNFEADLDYGLDECTLFDEHHIPFAQLPEFVTFIVGLASRAEEKKI